METRLEVCWRTNSIMKSKDHSRQVREETEERSFPEQRPNLWSDHRSIDRSVKVKEIKTKAARLPIFKKSQTCRFKFCPKMIIFCMKQTKLLSWQQVTSARVKGNSGQFSNLLESYLSSKYRQLPKTGSVYRCNFIYVVFLKESHKTSHLKFAASYGGSTANQRRSKFKLSGFVNFVKDQSASWKDVIIWNWNKNIVRIIAIIT